jgi:tetratricopeptide (TPR) repeat protein
MKSLSMGVLRGLVLGAAIPGVAGMVAAQQPAPGVSPTGAEIESLQRTALQEGEAGKTDEAIRDYQHALEFRPEWKEGWWNLGTLQYGANRFVEAKATFQRVVGFAPELGVAWALLGLSEFETKDFNDSLVHLEKAQSLGIKDDAEVERVSTYHLGLLLVRDGEFERATDLLLARFGGGGAVSEQVKFALGLAMLRIPLLPEQVDPSREALVLAAGGVAAAGADAATLFPEFLKAYPDVPYSQYAYGLALAKAGRDRDALEAFRLETRSSPRSALPWIEISGLELRLGAAKEALGAGEKAVALDAANPAAHEALSSSLRALGETQKSSAERSLAETPRKERQGPEERIVRRYSIGAASGGVGPGEDQERWSRAMREFSAGEYSAVVSDLKEWLRSNPGSGTGWAVLGLSEFSLKDNDNALIHLERGEQLGVSGSAESVQSAKYTLGILLIHAGEFERATEVLWSAWKTGPPDRQVESALGLALLRRAIFPDQEREADQPLVNAAGKVAVLLQQSEYDAAFAQLKPLLQQYPATPFLHYAYGTALLSLSEFDEAAAQMHAEAAISPSSALPHLRLALISLRQHDPANAIPPAKRALELAPNSADGHYLLGRALLESGDDATALRELEIAGRLSPGSPEVHFTLAKAYARAKMPEKAERERATFSQLNEIAEKQRSQHGSQIYAGPHDAGQVTTSSPAN